MDDFKTGLGDFIKFRSGGGDVWVNRKLVIAVLTGLKHGVGTVPILWLGNGQQIEVSDTMSDVVRRLNGERIVKLDD